jgi:hypothetical protein
VSVTYKLGVTAAGMIEHASLLEATEGKRQATSTSTS